jgi:hypothetical protein
MLIPVISALAVGVAFIVLFSAIFTSNRPLALPISDMRLQENVEKTKEVTAFLSKYPDANIQYHSSDTRTIDYSTSIDIFPQGQGYGQRIHSLMLNIFVHRITGQVEQMALTCTITDGINDSQQTTIFENIEEEILNGSCLDVVEYSLDSDIRSIAKDTEVPRHIVTFAGVIKDSYLFPFFEIIVVPIAVIGAGVIAFVTIRRIKKRGQKNEG